jgi:hypothetical protein
VTWQLFFVVVALGVMATPLPEELADTLVDEF